METLGNEPGRLWSWLKNAPGAFALVVGANSAATAERLSSDWNTPVTNAGHHLTIEDETGWVAPERSLRGHRVLTGLEVLFWPEVLVDPLRCGLWG